MDTIENIARLKTTDIKRLEMIRKRLKISGTFISQCLGLSDTTWSGWVTQKGKIPEKYLDQVANIFQTVGNLQNGERCLAVKKVDKKETKQLDIGLIFEFLEDVATPKIAIFEDKDEEMEKLIKRHSEDALMLLELLAEHKPTKK